MGFECLWLGGWRCWTRLRPRDRSWGVGSRGRSGGEGAAATVGREYGLDIEREADDSHALIRREGKREAQPPPINGARVLRAPTSVPSRILRLSRLHSDAVFRSLHSRPPANHDFPGFPSHPRRPRFCRRRFFRLNALRPDTRPCARVPTLLSLAPLVAVHHRRLHPSADSRAGGRRRRHRARRRD